MTEQISVDNEKYTVILQDNGAMVALRYGEPWRDLTGDKLIFSLAFELKEAREQIAKLTKGDKYAPYK